jgi:hypothetical protein
MSTKTIRRRITDGTLTTHRVGPRAIRIERDSVLAMLDSPLGAAEPHSNEAGTDPHRSNPMIAEENPPASNRAGLRQAPRPGVRSIGSVRPRDPQHHPVPRGAK